MNSNTSLRWIAVITAEKIDEARKELGLAETATRAELKRRYRILAKKWHPDVCPDENTLKCQERFRRIAVSKNLLMRLISVYRYSLRREEIERDQESHTIKYIRVYGNLFHSFAGLEDDPVAALGKRSRNLLTADNILHASELLGLSDFASQSQIISAFRTRIAQIESEDFPPERTKDIQWAYKLLMKYIEEYSYSFRPDDIRKYQEDAIERHRKQFGNEPMWAGGGYDEPAV